MIYCSSVKSKLIQHVKNRNESIVVGLFYVFILFFASLIQSFAFHQYFDRVLTVGARLRISVANLIYKKSLCLSNVSRKESTMGQMVSILAVDTQNLTEFPHHCNSAWSCLLSITIAITLLWFQIGVSAFAGVLVMALMLPITSFITTKVMIA